MTAAEPVTGDVYVIRPVRVRESIKALLERQTHQHFIAYLYLRWLAAREGRVDGLEPSWAELGDWLRVEGGPRPHLRPFWKGRRNAGQEWLSENLAGSFAPSSLRSEPQRVIQIDAGGTFSLREDHAELALEHLLLGTPMEAVALAAFLYRDYGFVSAAEPGWADLVAVFRQGFGYDEDHAAEFDTLYEVTWAGDGPWFERFEEASAP